VVEESHGVAEVRAWFESYLRADVGQQIARLRAAGYDRTETLESETNMLNATTALYKAYFSWLRAGGSEIARMRLAYVITHAVSGRRISALVVGAP
jgi:hypothetical protein